MSRWLIPGPERRVPPLEYEEHLARLGGYNRFGEPNFRLAWGQTYTDTVYGQMHDSYRGRHTRLMFGDVPAWHLLEWKPPETFGTPEFWYSLTWNNDDLTHVLGDYPRRGFYLPCPFNLYVKRIIPGVPWTDPKTGNSEIRGERLEIDAMPLAYWVLDLLVPNILKEKQKTYMQKQFAVRCQQEKEKKAWRDRVIDAYRNAAPAFGGADFDKSENRERMLAKIAAMKFPVSAEQVARKFGRGHAVRPIRKSGK